MSNILQPGDSFPNFKLPDQNGNLKELMSYTAQSEADKRYGFKDGYPIIVVFYRGFFCPRDQQQFKMLVAFQKELKVNFCKLIAISTDTPKVSAAFRAGLGASWDFLSDTERQLIEKLTILDETEGEYAHCSLPYTFVLKPTLEIYKVYNGWYFIGRPTLEELRQDLRAIMEKSDYYNYEAYNTSHVKKIRIPQQTWLEKTKVSDNFLEGIVISFNIQTGNGYIKANDIETNLFFNFTAIPGEGYRTIKRGTNVRFELIETYTGLSARNIQEMPS